MTLGIPRKQGTLYIEGRLHSNGRLCFQRMTELQKEIESRLASTVFVVDLMEDILQRDGEYQHGPMTSNKPDRSNIDASEILGPLYTDVDKIIQTLKVAEYVGAESEPEAACYALTSVCVKVQLYQMQSQARPLDENKELQQARVTPMPHLMFDGKWDELVFDQDIKTDLIWTMRNTLRFAPKCNPEAGGDMDPLTLLYGPSGSGKTTLCQGLAQKISIRLGERYRQTKLIEIKTATILSKYYSESAKQVDQILASICKMCQESPGTFICVLIDEVESIANSREWSNRGFEAQDSLRATNALLTGLDRAEAYPNVMFLCTSNFIATLDPAFLDRCALRVAIGAPSSKSQYVIFSGRIRGLIARDIILSDTTLPTYNEALIEFNDPDTRNNPGGTLMQIIERIRTINLRCDSAISGRALTQIPETAIRRYLREEDCDLTMALKFVEMLLRQQPLILTAVSDITVSNKTTRPEEDEEDVVTENASDHEAVEGIETRGKKRKLVILLEEECYSNVLIDLIAGIRASKGSGRPPAPRELRKEEEQAGDAEMRSRSFTSGIGSAFS